MLSKETASVLKQSLQASTELDTQYNALLDKVCNGIVPQRDTHAAMLFGLFIPAYRLPQCVQNTANLVIRSEINARHIDLIRFDEATLATLGRDTQAALTMSLVNDLSCKEAMAHVSETVSASKEGKIALPFSDLRDGYVEVYQAAKDICTRTMEYFDEDVASERLNRKKLKQFVNHLDLNLQIFRECYMGLVPKNEISLPNVGTYKLQDTNARPYNRNFAWPTIRSLDLRR